MARPNDEVPVNVTLADVARRARVSPATASRVINGSTKPVADGLRERVLKAVAAHAEADVLAIGHQPDLEMLAAFLLTARTEARLRLRPGGCVCFELAGGAPPALLEWCLLPEQIELMAKNDSEG